MSEVATLERNQSVMNNTSLLFNPESLDRIVKFAELMASGTATVPRHLQGKPSDCLAITMQSARWGMDPFVVGQKTHVINGVLGYEAQLVNAVITSSNAVVGRFHYKYGGDWEKIVGMKDKRDESGLFIEVGAILRGEEEVTWGEPVYLADVQTRNSPLWKTMPKQQIAYLAVKYWARLYCPEVILGVYTPEELEDRPIKDITPPKERVSIDEITTQQQTTNEEPIKETQGEFIPKFDAEAFRLAIDDVQTVEEAKNIRAEIENLKNEMGINLFTELKNKAVQAYHRIDARNALEASINSLPESGSPEATEAFEKVDKLLRSSKRKLGDELYESFSITLNDMRPEYQ
ncbi:TPA: recombinase RecT [Proteus mirabilis]|uniref:Enterohemolysin n=1 Tax=Proteus mirabilis TaxID=584 RepID=A0AAJ0Y9X9_PROMI|nr:RecT family recombinase [Proteus mirabilis]ARX34518.1 enterohemolysin [Proteus mirabilis]EJD6314479.1 recombinase RecT [Proteus mirabilis]EJD6319807.1 recombinase RecT [Proteus mirabilis]EJD6438509.1 recombinase RecT [Proteus mirabilis]EJD6528130.1 recombinase RecT [Proteus mirabilis]